MAERVGDVMTPDPITVPTAAPIVEAARTMKEADVGAVIVTDPGKGVVGILTDRDIVVRGVAGGRDPARTKVGDIASTDEVVAVSPDDDVEKARRMMSERAIRRVPVLEGDRPVGILSIGDLAIEKEPAKVGETLADVSAAEPNR